jgi:O-antigen/teichoic acid export membrane protein
VDDPATAVEALPDRSLGLPTPVGILARSGAIAGAIKLISAALSFFMFIAIAMVTDERQFGLFGATYAGASLVSFFSIVGQQAVVLRFWPQYASADDLPAAQAFMLRSLTITIAGLVLCSLGMIALGFLPYVSNNTPEWLGLCLSASLLALGLGWSEVASGALRAKTELIAGLLPRDITWRALTVAVMLVIHFWLDWKISAESATWICAVLLLLAVAPQSWKLLRDTLSAPRRPLSSEQEREFRHVTTGLWGVTSLPPALAQVSTLLVAGILGPEIAGAVFVAERTTRLVIVALSGINQALAPEISSAFHSGNIAHVQRIASLTALASTAVAVIALIGFWIMGDLVLGIFQASYATPTMVAVLLIFGAGAAVGSASGPVEVLLQLTGGQHILLNILLLVNPAGLALTALATYYYGPLGAAAGIAATNATWNVVAAISARRRINIDPSLIGLFRKV